MDTFLSQNAALLIAILGLLVTIIVQWDVLTRRISNVVGTFERVPFIIFRLLAIALSGTFVSGVFWVMIDFLAVGRVSLNAVLFDLASGAAWGIPIAVISTALSKSLDRVFVTSILVSVVILVLFGPEEVIARPEMGLTIKRIYAITLFLLVAVMGLTIGYAGFRTKTFLDSISTATIKDRI